MLEAHWIYRYDERKRRVSSQMVVADPKNDQQVYGRCSDCDLSPGETTYQCDENNRVTEERMFQPGMKLVRLEKYLYDAHGNLLPPGSTFCTILRVTGSSKSPLLEQPPAPATG